MFKQSFYLGFFSFFGLAENNLQAQVKQLKKHTPYHNINNSWLSVYQSINSAYSKLSNEAQHTQPKS
jgi:hypothetical protein